VSTGQVSSETDDGFPIEFIESDADRPNPEQSGHQRTSIIPSPEGRRSIIYRGGLGPGRSEAHAKESTAGVRAFKRNKQRKGKVLLCGLESLVPKPT